MPTKLIEYLPPEFLKIAEYSELCRTEQPFFDDLWKAAQLILDNQFIDTADENGVCMWEKELGIVPLAADTLEERKQRIKNAWTYGIVYTYRWLCGWLKDFSGSADVKDYTLNVKLPSGCDYANILDTLRRYISANMAINPTITLKESDLKLYAGLAIRTSFARNISTSDTAETIETIALLADENGDLLADEQNKILYEVIT